MLPFDEMILQQPFNLLLVCSSCSACWDSDNPLIVELLKTRLQLLISYRRSSESSTWYSPLLWLVWLFIPRTVGSSSNIIFLLIFLFFLCQVNWSWWRWWIRETGWWYDKIRVNTSCMYFKEYLMALSIS